MATEIYNTDGIIKLTATDSVPGIWSVSSIILQGTAAGSFVFSLGNASITLTTTATNFVLQLNIGRRVNGLTLTSGPTGAAMYIILSKTV